MGTDNNERRYGIRKVTNIHIDNARKLNCKGLSFIFPVSGSFDFNKTCKVYTNNRMSSIGFRRFVSPKYSLKKSIKKLSDTGAIQNDLILTMDLTLEISGIYPKHISRPLRENLLK